MAARLKIILRSQYTEMPRAVGLETGDSESTFIDHRDIRQVVFCAHKKEGRARGNLPNKNRVTVRMALIM